VSQFPEQLLGGLFPVQDIRPEEYSGVSVDFGIPFLPGILTGARLSVQFAFGANPRSREPQTWNFFDVTTDVRQSDGNGINIAPFGRSDEFSTSQPAGCTFELDNTLGDYSKKLPTGKWYPNIKRNVPMRILLNLTGYAADTQVLYQGNVTGWVPSWDETGELAIVTVTVNGTLRRLNQGKSPLRSAYTRGVGTSSDLVGFWPCEDGTDSTTIAEYTGLQSPIQINSSLVDFQQGTPPVGTDKVLKLSSGASLGAVVNYTSTNNWTISMLVNLPADVAGDTTLISWVTTGSYPNMAYVLTSNYLGTGQAYVRFQGRDSSGALVLDDAIPFSDGNEPSPGVDLPVFGDWINIVLSMYTDTPNNRIFYEHSLYNAVPDTKLLGNGFISGKTGGQFKSWSIVATGAWVGGNLGQIAVWSDSLDWDDRVNVNVRKFLNGYAPGKFHSGETATQRLSRLFNEEGIPLAITGSSNVIMGAQGIDTFINLVRECETADDGILYDGASAGCAYISRSAKYNQSAALTLSFTNGDVDDPFVPTDDDQRDRNLSVVSRKNGSSATYEDTDGEEGTDEIDVYDSSLTVNVSTDAYLLDRAQWEVAKGTIGGFRYPTFGIDLASSPSLIPAWSKIFIGARIDATSVDSVVAQHPPGTIASLLEGYTMFINQFNWKVTANCSPYAPYQVGVLGTDRLQTAGSSLASDAGVGATTLTVNVTGQLWSTSAGDYPSMIEVDGILITVTAVSGVSSPQTFTVDPATVIIPLHAGDAVTVYQPLLVSL
jgi:hypothetical protein